MKLFSLYLLWFLLSLALICQPVFADNKAYLIEVDGAIGPVSQDLIIRTLEKANAESAQNNSDLIASHGQSVVQSRYLYD